MENGDIDTPIKETKKEFNTSRQRFLLYEKLDTVKKDIYKVINQPSIRVKKLLMDEILKSIDILIKGVSKNINDKLFEHMTEELKLISKYIVSDEEDLLKNMCDYNIKEKAQLRYLLIKYGHDPDRILKRGWK